MFCKHCGKQVNEHAVVCPNCGCAMEPKKDVIIHTVDDSPKSNGCAIAGFIFGLLGFVGGFAFFDLPCILAFILSLVGLSHAKRLHTGKGLAIAGLIFSLLGTAIIVGVVIAAIAAGSSIFAFIASIIGMSGSM